MDSGKVTISKHRTLSNFGDQPPSLLRRESQNRGQDAHKVGLRDQGE